MAFSTQKSFFHVPFKNEELEFECYDPCIRLKTYPSTTDDRCWAADEEQKSRFVADLVACNTLIRGPGGPSGPGEQAGPGGARSGARAGPEGMYGSDLVVGDSLINAADETIGRMQALMIKNNLLQKKLDDSNDKLKTAQDESKEIRRIMSQRYDPQKAKALRAKINQVVNAGRITPSDEKELNDLMDSIDDLNKAHDILSAENGNLKRLIEKQSKRCKMDSIAVDPEHSTDVPYLQQKINDMGKELAMLRQMEDEFAKCCASSNKSGFSPDKDAENIKRILAERDALRRKVKNLDSLGEKVSELEGKANESKNVCCELENTLKRQNKCMCSMQREMMDMQNYYENEVEKSKGNEEILKCRCNQMKQELVAAKVACQRSECQQMEIDVLRNELRKREIALNAYECQYQQIMLKAKMFKSAGYRFLDDLPNDCECCTDGAEEGA
ncbi:hypothetical protein KR018_000139, partial [Drosophila ironensis]